MERRAQGGVGMITIGRTIAASLFVIFFTATALPVSGAEPARTADPAAKILSLEEAIGIALEQNRDIQKAEAYRRWVRGKYVQERSAALPQFTVSASGSRTVDESIRQLYGEFSSFFPTRQDVFTGEVSLSQAVYTWGKVGAAIKAAKIGFMTADDQLRLYRQAAIRDVTAAFYDVLLGKELLAIAAQNLELKQKHLDEAQKRYSLGTATDYDVLAAEVALENARPGVIRSENFVKTARERLQFVLAERGSPVDATGLLEAVIEPVPGYEEALSLALASRPELKNLEHTAGVLQQLVNIAKAGDKPRVDFRAGYGFRKFLVGDLDSQGKTWNAGFFLSYPIFDGFKTRGSVIQARSDLSTTDIETEKVRDSVRLDIRTALNAVEEAEGILKALSGTVQQAEKLLDMAEKGWLYGVKIRLDVEDAQLNLIQAKGNLAGAKRDYLVARTNLQWAMGVLGEETR
jgi:outer membrane protein TolC